MKPEASLKPDYLGDKRTDKLCARWNRFAIWRVEYDRDSQRGVYA